MSSANSLTDKSPEVQSLVEGEEQRGEHTSLGADCPGAEYDFPQPHLLTLVCQGVSDPLTDAGWHNELAEFGIEGCYDDGVECPAEVHKLYLQRSFHMSLESQGVAGFSAGPC